MLLLTIYGRTLKPNPRGLERRAARKATSEWRKKDTARREAEEAARKKREEGWVGEAARWLAEYTARQKAAAATWEPILAAERTMLLRSLPKKGP
jgi:hypothetical protein